MQSLIPVFHSLGLAIVYNIWQVALLWIVYILFINKNALITSSAKYFLGTGIQLISIVLFIITFGYFLYHPTPFISIHQPAKFSAIISMVINKGNIYIPYIAMLYLGVLFFLLVKWLLHYFHTLQFYKPAIVYDNYYWNNFIEQFSAQFLWARKIQILLSQQIQSPVTIGFLKPVILVPLAGFNHLSQEQMEAVLLHEMAHIRRNDYLVNLIMTIIETILFFNPFTLFISKCIQKERENSCDDVVLSYQYQPQVYAEALLQLAYLSTATNAHFSMPAAKNDGVLLNRIRRIVGMAESREKTKTSVAVLLLTLMGIVLSGMYLLKVNDQPALTNTELTYTSSTKKITNNTFIVHHTGTVATASAVKHTIINSPEKNITEENKNDRIIDETVQALKTLKGIQIQKDKIAENNFTSTVNNITVSDDVLKEKLKAYTQLKSISIDAVKNKVDSITNAERRNLTAGIRKLNGIYSPAVYVYNDNNSMDSAGRTSLSIPDSLKKSSNSLFIVINQKNEKGEPVQLIIAIKQ